MTVLDKVRYLVDHADELNVEVHEYNDIVIIDAGVRTRPGYLVGALLIEIATGGLAHASFTKLDINGKSAPLLHIVTDNPVLACMCYQIAGWIVQHGSDVLYISGPGKVIAGKPKSIIERFCTRASRCPVLLVEVENFPSNEILQELRNKCRGADKLYIVLTSPRSIAGQVQICGRVVEVALFSLLSRGLDITHNIVSAIGQVLLPPTQSQDDPLRAIALCNDLILLTGDVTMVLDSSKVDVPEDVVYRDSDKTFSEVLHLYGRDFLLKIDPKMFKVARITLYFRDGVIQLGKLRYDKAISFIF